jgi:hypothetical protein
MSVNSTSVGDPARFRAFKELCRLREALAPAPRDRGRLDLIVRRVDPGGRRQTPERLVLSPDEGVAGDAWGRQAERKALAQIAVMQADVARLIANGQSLELFGDSLFLELDLSADNLPPGSRLRIGRAALEVTPEPHNGCRKFRDRFGVDALRFVGARELQHRKLRGIYLRVVSTGEIAIGDVVEVVKRAGA